MQSKDQNLTPNLTVSQTLLGKGSTGNVYIGHSLTPQLHQVAIKSIPLKDIDNEVTSYLLQCELEALKIISSCGNSSIVKLEDIVVVDGHCHIVMEILNGGTLRQFMDKNKRVQASLALKILRSLLSGYQAIEKNGIIHRDLKPSNILFETDPTLTQQLPIPKIIDFGYCIYDKVQKKPTSYYNVGSPRYMSPEAYIQNQYSDKSDIWALGIIFYEMLTGACLDKGKALEESFQIIRQKGIPIPASMDTKSRKILQGMLMIDPKKRISCDRLIQLIDSNSPMASPIPILDTKQIQQKQNQQNPNLLNTPQRASLVSTSSPLRSSTFLTRSVGFSMSPQQQQQNDNRLNNLLQIKLEQSKHERNEGLLTDRSNNEEQIRGRALPLSSSLQNLHKTAQNNPLLIRNSLGGQLPFNILVERKINPNFALPSPLAQGQARQQRILTTPPQNLKTGNNLMELRQSVNMNFGEQMKSKVHMVQEQANHVMAQNGKHTGQSNIGPILTGQVQVNGQNVHGLHVQFNQINGQLPNQHIQQIQPQQQHQHHQTPQHLIKPISQIQQLQPPQNQQTHSLQQSHQIQPHQPNHIIQNYQQHPQQMNQSPQLSPQVSPQLHPQLSPQLPPPMQLTPPQQQQFQPHHSHQPINLSQHHLQHQQPHSHPQHHIQLPVQNHPQQIQTHTMLQQPFREQNKSEIMKANKIINKNIRLISMIPQQQQHLLPLKSKFNENVPPMSQMQLIKGRI